MRDLLSLIIALVLSSLLIIASCIKAAKNAPDDYIDLMVMTEERHAEQNTEDIE